VRADTHTLVHDCETAEYRVVAHVHVSGKLCVVRENRAASDLTTRPVLWRDPRQWWASRLRLFWLPGWLLRHQVSVFLHRIRFPGRPMFTIEAAEPFIGKRIIVGITHVDHLHRPVRQEQYHGRIVRVSEREGIVIQTPSGEEKHLPPDLRAMFAARPGEYTLPSTGQVVAGPDLQTSWTYTLSPVTSSVPEDDARA